MLKRNNYNLLFLCEGEIDFIEVYCESFEKAEALYYDIYGSTALDMDLISITKTKEDN